MENTWNNSTIEYMAKQINEISNITNMNILLKAVSIKLCSFAPNKNNCIGCPYNYIGMCRTIFSFLENQDLNDMPDEDMEEV